MDRAGPKLGVVEKEPRYAVVQGLRARAKVVVQVDDTCRVLSEAAKVRHDDSATRELPQPGMPGGEGGRGAPASMAEAA